MLFIMKILWQGQKIPIRRKTLEMNSPSHVEKSLKPQALNKPV